MTDDTDLSRGIALAGDERAELSAWELAVKASNQVEQEGGLPEFVRDWGFAGLIAAFFLNAIETVRSFGTLILGPPRALGRGLIMLIETFMNGLGDVFGAGTETTVRSFTDGMGALFGPLAQPAALGVVMLTFATMIWVWSKLEIQPFTFLTDTIGN